MNKKIIKDLIPPLLIRTVKKSPFFNFGLHWKGDYSSWEKALDNSSGYDAEEIVEKVKNSLLKVKNGEAAYERDSVLFDKMEYDWPVVASLMWVAAKCGYLNVMDFGGSLGSTYFQNRTFLKDVKDVAWNIIEQAHFVKCGKENFENEHLRFFYDAETCIRDNKINLIILSSVLPYLKEPYSLLEKIQNFKVDYVLIDKMPLIDSTSDRLTIQNVPSEIYKASYPAWFFSRAKFTDFIERQFDVVADFDRNIDSNISSVFKGLLLAKKSK